MKLSEGSPVVSSPAAPVAASGFLLSRFILGLDIGSASIGWALIDPAAQQLVAAGSRIFDAGVDAVAFAAGQLGSSNNTARRAARLMRRQTRRRAARRQAFFALLQDAGLLPPSPMDNRPGSRAEQSRVRHVVLDEVDRNLRHRWAGSPELARYPAPDQILPYFLRARALDHALAPDELGRALYHLIQRRGFQSNRRDATVEAGEGEKQKQKATDDASVVKREIGDLALAMEAAGKRTLGEYFCGIDPAETRIRKRFVGRKSYRAEFDAIWQAQAPHFPGSLTPAFEARARHLLFYQRPVGAGRPCKCELEPEQPRAPLCSLPAQRFRLLQKVNDLRIVLPSLESFPLNSEERRRLLEVLDQEGDLTFAAMKKRGLVHLPSRARLNLEAGGEKKIPGNRTVAKLRPILGAEWDAFPAAKRDRVVAIWSEPLEDEQIEVRAKSEFGLSDERARDFAKASLEDGYAKLSLAALRKLLPLMEGGMSFKAAETETYGVRFSGGAIRDRLPPAAEVLSAVANPAVMRALAELRQLVNAIVAEFGKPFEIRIELARDLKRNARQRQALSKDMRDQQVRRNKIVSRIVGEAHLPAPSRGQTQVGLLYEEACGLCPYCGEAFSFAQAFDDQGTVEVDHILPIGRFPDNSFGNKVLAHRSCNQQKSGRTPAEAFSHDTDLWDQILTRVKKWKNATKLAAFQVTAAELDPGASGTFASRRLNDTRYTTTQAAQYLGHLYGGRDLARGDGTTRRVVHASSGLVTATLRRGWLLESILRQPGESENGLNRGKPRDDHRHHAVDAVVIALSSSAAVQQMAAAAAADNSAQSRISSRTLRAPWPDFIDRVRPVILGIQVSHRAKHRLSGPLHNETTYSRGHADANGKLWKHLRKPVYTLTAKQIEAIVDARVREAVRAKLASVGKVELLEEDPPCMATRLGKMVRIRSVRIRSGPAATAVIGWNRRAVELANNHHIELFSGPGRRGGEEWRADVVSVFEAMRRKAACRCRRGQRCDCIVRRRLGDFPDFEFLYSLMSGDLVQMAPRGGGAPQILVIRSFSQSDSGAIDCVFVPHTAAGLVKKSRVTRTNELRERGCVKVALDVLGRLRQEGG